MTTCDFIRLSDNLIKCINCDLIIDIQDDLDDYPIFPCFGSISSPFSSTQEDAKIIKTTALELKPDNLNESEMCSEDQILHRYSICGGCEFFDNNSCTKCGCLLSRNRIYMSKLAWKNETCPIGLWSKISD